MTTQHDKAKRWQIGLRELMIVVAVTPVIGGIAGGAFGKLPQAMLLYALVVGSLYLLVIAGIVLLSALLTIAIDSLQRITSRHD